MQAADPLGHRAAQDEPHDDLGTLDAAELGVLGVGHRREPFRIVLEKVEEALVPRRIVEAGALAVHLVREPAGGDDGDAQRIGLAFDRPPQRPAQPEAAPGRDRELQHADLQRHHGGGPAVLVRQHRG